MKVGDKVRIKGTKHETKIVKETSNGYYILEKKLPRHCCGFYACYELEKIKND